DQTGRRYADIGFIPVFGTNGILPGEFGAALAPLPDGTVLVSGPKTAPNGTGRVYLLTTNAQTTSLSWTNPDGNNATNTFFGRSLAALPGNRFAASSLAVVGASSRGKVFLFDASTSAAPFIIISNTAITFETFATALAALGTSRLLIGDWGLRFVGTPMA